MPECGEATGSGRVVSTSPALVKPALPESGMSYQASCGLVRFFPCFVPCFVGISAVLGLGAQNHHLSFSTPKTALCTLQKHYDFDSKNAKELGKNEKDKWCHFHASTRPPSPNAQFLKSSSPRCGSGPLRPAPWATPFGASQKEPGGGGGCGKREGGL